MTAIGALTSSYWSGSSSTTAQSELFDSDTFLTLLTAQLKYQDPSKPADTSEIMSQTATLAQVEKLSSLLSTQSAGTAAAQAQAAAAMVGNTVTYTTAEGTESSGLVESVSFTSAGAVLTLSDGSTLDLTAVTRVEPGDTA